MDKRLLCFVLATFALAAEAKEPNWALEAKIGHALNPIAKQMKASYEPARYDPSSPYRSIYFSTQRPCEGVRSCTAFEVYYDQEAHCERYMTRQGFQAADPTGNARDTYGLKVGGTCYEISVRGRRNAEKIANVLRHLH